MQDILGINYYFGDSEKDNKVFDESLADLSARGFVIQFKKWIEQRYDVSVQTWDCIDWHSPQVKAVLYFDYSWRYALRDKILKQIPFEKRALMMIEPANVNPSLYYVPFFRNRFHTVFTWDVSLLKKHPDYLPVNVPVGAEPSEYRENPFADRTFSSKKLLIAVSRNRFSYMPQSTYRKRVQAYRFFSSARKDEFDLYGHGWSTAGIASFRGVIEGDWGAKVSVMSNYRFAICFENNAFQEGYISEKILDCFCSRCVPIYYGSKGIERRIPRECYIDMRDFPGLEAINQYISSMPESQYNKYINAINKFLKSSAVDFFSTRHYFTTLAEGLHLTPR